MSEENKKIVDKNSDILFIYEAKMCNPNGDPDDENKPRIDYERSINLVSDVRLKRYIRDYLMDFKGKTIFVSKKDGVVNAKKRLATILNLKDTKKIKLSSEQLNIFKQKAIDVRMFGAIIPDVQKKEGNVNVTFTGPIQFNWGYSLNKVTGPIESSGITSHFQTGKSSEEEESTKGAGAMGKDYRVAYSIIAFHGIISAKRAEKTELKWDDINLLDEAMIHAIPLEATTRSKIGQHPLLYIRIEYTTDDFFLDDLRKYVKIADNSGEEIPFEKTEKLSSVKEYKLDLTPLSKKLKNFADKINKIYFWKNDELEIEGWNMIDEGNNKYWDNEKRIPVVELKFDNNKDDGNDKSKD